MSARFACAACVKIAQVAPLTESVPPRLYGGTERVVAFLTDELVRQGHHVTLFASGDSRTGGQLEAVCPIAQRLAGGIQDALAAHVLMLERVAQRQDDFDLIHFHIAQLHFPIARRLRTAHITTLHGRLDLQELCGLYDEFGDIPVVSISDAQRIPLPQAGWVGTVYHGLPAELLRFREQPEDYLAFLGRVSPEKGLDRAIAIATACGLQLRVAAKVDPADQDYFAASIQRLLDNPLVEFIGEIGDGDKSDFLGGASALLFPINWPEPFGLVLVEAMACGVPVIAFSGGSVPEIIEDGVTGFVVNTIEEAVAATRRISEISRRTCRTTFERRFSASRMAADYVRLYEQVIRGRHRHRVA